jgi:hypothetical protein
LSIPIYPYRPYHTITIITNDSPGGEGQDESNDDDESDDEPYDGYGNGDDGNGNANDGDGDESGSNARNAGDGNVQCHARSIWKGYARARYVHFHPANISGADN